MFYMTFYKRGGKGHDLRKLFDKLPEQIRGDIKESYTASLATSTLPATLEAIAFRFSPDVPAKPENLIVRNVGIAEGVIDEAADAFERGRYFYEKIGSEDWAVIAYPIDHMLFLSHVLDTVYDEYSRRGGWH
jgi:hypothetical protein